MLPGERIRHARQLVGLSTKGLDELADKAPGLVWSLEKSGGARAEATTLEPIARALGLTLDYIVSGVGDPPTTESVSAAVAIAQGALASKRLAKAAAEKEEGAPASERKPKAGKGKAS